MQPEPKSRLKLYIRLFIIALIQVTLVSSNVKQVVGGHYIGAFFIGGGISLCWAYNVRGMVLNTKLAPFAYAFGAAVGTVVGMFLADIIYGPSV